MDKNLFLNIAKKHYTKKEVKKILTLHAKNREAIAKYFDKFGKRPDTIEYENDIEHYVENNVTSFHCSVELWKNPLELGKQLSEDEINKLRIGWDLLIDVDCKFLDYSKEATKLIVKALEWHDIKNYGIKFSGNKGFHIILNSFAFPQKIKYEKEIETKDFFPIGARIIASYLSELIENELRDVMLSMDSVADIAKALNKKENELLLKNVFNPFSIVSIDTVLMSHRHLYRMPYSLHEKTGLVSIVMNKQQLNNFNISLAKHSNLENFYEFLKKPRENEANELMLNAIDWQHREKILALDLKIKMEKLKPEPQKIEINIPIEKIEQAYCDCIKNILQGIKHDGRKRALFILLTYFRSLGYDFEKIEQIMEEWNKKNYRLLKENYIKTQINWHKKQIKQILPPNHDSIGFYKDLNILGESCKLTKNPVVYTLKLLREKQREQKETEQLKNKKLKKSKSKLKVNGV